MELVCKRCSSQFRANLQLPLTQPVRVICPACNHQMVLRPAPAATRPEAPPRRREAVIADVTGDQKNDLIVLVHDRILVYPQE